MPAAARLNDPDTSDGQIISGGSSDVLINGKPAALADATDSRHAPYGPPNPPHAAATVVVASGSVIVNGKGLAYVGSQLSCGHSISSGSPDVDVAA